MCFIIALCEIDDSEMALQASWTVNFLSEPAAGSSLFLL